MGSQYFWGKRSQMGQFEYPCFVPFHLKFPLSDTCPFSVLFFIWDQTRIRRADISKKIPPGITQRQRLFISWGVYFSLSENINNPLFLRYWRILTHHGEGQSSRVPKILWILANCSSVWFVWFEYRDSLLPTDRSPVFPVLSAFLVTFHHMAQSKIRFEIVPL